MGASLGNTRPVRQLMMPSFSQPEDVLLELETRSASGSGSPAGGSAAMQESVDEQALSLWDVDWTQSSMLVFIDRRLERIFCEQTYDRRLTLGVVMCFFWAPCGLTEFLYVGAFRYLAASDVAAIVFAWTRVLLITLLLSCGVRLKHNRASFESVFATLLCITPVFVFTNNEFRMSKLFGTRFYYTTMKAICTAKGAETCADDSRSILALLVLGSVPMILSLRISKAWMFVPWSVFLYCIFSLTGLGPLPISSHVIVLAMYCSVNCFLLLGTYRIEVESRRRFVEIWQLRIENASQRLEIKRQEELLADVEERLEAMGLSTVPVIRGHTSVVSINRLGGSRTARLPQVQGPVVNPWPPIQQGEVPNSLLVRSMAGRNTEASRLQKMAARIRDPDYGTREFFEDCVATFPELELFFVGGPGGTSSGNSGEVEYQRTIGALFAVFWMIRSDIDGREAFSYGVDDHFEVYQNPPPVEAEALKLKRLAFFREMEWGCFEALVHDALNGCQQRLQAMLCLTAFHDIMKVEGLLPRVQPSHAPYEGYGAGETIYDHDIALAYVLDNFPDLLPSYRVLPKVSRDLILLTQAKLHFNHGWFVQSESTPGAMLKHFKQILKRAAPADIAFYFFHWVTDLSGAEGRPLAGAEKFVIRFPQAVLCSFLWSIPFLQRLTLFSETEVVETYLAARWEKLFSDGDRPPEGNDGIAIMRLAVMAQRNAHLVPEAFQQLQADARQLLTAELSRTGMEGQYYSSNVQKGGPAMFVYYGPALLQCCKTAKEMGTSLRTLAALYSAGRSLWPLSADAEGQTITLEAGELKANAAAVVSGQKVIAGQLMVLERRGLIEGVVSLVAGEALNILLGSGTRFVALDPDCIGSMSDSGSRTAGRGSGRQGGGCM